MLAPAKARRSDTKTEPRFDWSCLLEDAIKHDPSTVPQIEKPNTDIMKQGIRIFLRVGGVGSRKPSHHTICVYGKSNYESLQQLQWSLEPFAFLSVNELGKENLQVVTCSKLL